MKRFAQVMVGCAAMLVVVSLAFAEGMEKKAASAKMAKPMMATFLIEAPHTEEECLMVMDASNKAKELDKWEFGCMSGNHTAYRIVQAADENAALAMVPEMVRAKAHVYKLAKMTPSQLDAAHKAHM